MAGDGIEDGFQMAAGGKDQAQAVFRAGLPECVQRGFVVRAVGQGNERAVEIGGEHAGRNIRIWLEKCHVSAHTL
jgi:hypothetical protein